MLNGSFNESLADSVISSKTVIVQISYKIINSLIELNLPVSFTTLILDLAIHIGNAAVALGGSIELANLFYSETLHKSLPHARPQPISHG